MAPTATSDGRLSDRCEVGRDFFTSAGGLGLFVSVDDGWKNDLIPLRQWIILIYIYILLLFYNNSLHGEVQDFFFHGSLRGTTKR